MSSFDTLRSLVEQLESEVATAAQSTRSKMQPERAAQLEDIKSRIAKLRADLEQLGDLDLS